MTETHYTEYVESFWQQSAFKHSALAALLLTSQDHQ